MAESCPNCGVALSAAAMIGLCPRCMAVDFFAPDGFDTGGDAGDGLDIPGESRRNFAGFQLLEELGRGGMGVVFRAKQLSLGREVALKFLLHGMLAGDAALARFREEAETAASLRHPNIVSIFEVGEEQGRHYLAMELVHGRPLSELLHHGPLPASRAATYLQRTAFALHYAHERGVLHRDLKPANVLIDDCDEPRVTDFGLAKRINEAQRPAEDRPLTLTGQVLGTPAYISPEQAGARGTLDVRSDIYSLGALFYHLITGRPPFVGESPTHVLRQVAENEPVAPCLLNPSLPRDLEIICLKCLEKEPGRRYASARELADDLGRFLRGEPIHARPISPAGRAWRWCKRNAALATALLGIALLLVSLAVGSTIAARRIETLRLDALTNLYASDMRLAQQAIAESKFGVAVERLERHRPRNGDPDVRGFEWRHFWNQCQSDELITLGSHTNQAQRALFSHDGRLIATASTHVQIWDAATHRSRTLFPCGDFVRALSFSPDDRRLAVAEQSGRLRLFDVASDREIALWQQPGPTPFALRWTTNESQVELWADGQRALWDWSEGTLKRTAVLDGTSNRDSVSDNGIRASIQRNPWRLVAWQDDKLRANLHANGPALATAVSADGQRFALGEFSGQLTLFALEPLPLTNRVQAHRGLINVLTFTAKGDRIASAGMDQVIRLWDTTKGLLVNELRGHRRPIWSLAFSPDGEWLVSGDADGVVKLWPTRGNRHDIWIPGEGKAVMSADGATMAFAGTDGVRWFRAGVSGEAATPLTEPQFRSGRPLSVSATHLLWLQTNGVLQLRDSKGSVTSVPLPPAVDPEKAWCSPDGRFLLYESVDRDGIVAWNLAAGQKAWEVPVGATHARLLAVSGNSRRVVIGDTAGYLRILELATGREIPVLRAHLSAAYAADFSRDGQQLVSAGHDGAVNWWDVDSGRLLGSFRSTSDAYWTVALAPDGRRIAAGTSESSIVVWDTTSRQEVAAFAIGGALEPVEGTLRFTADGTALLLWNHNAIRQWTAPPLANP